MRRPSSPLKSHKSLSGVGWTVGWSFLQVRLFLYCAPDACCVQIQDHRPRGQSSHGSRSFKTRELRPCLSLSAPHAGMFVKALLCDAIEGERGNTALQAWIDHSPWAVRTTPACEIFVFCPDHASCHWDTLACGLQRKDGLPREAKRAVDRKCTEFERDMSCCLIATDTLARTRQQAK